MLMHVLLLFNSFADSKILLKLLYNCLVTQSTIKTTRVTNIPVRQWFSVWKEKPTHSESQFCFVSH